MNAGLSIRDAREGDMAAITEIYNEIVQRSTAIFNDRPVDVEDRLRYWKERRAKRHPMLVACEGDTIAGYATLSDFRSWPGYRYTVEHTVHVGEAWRGKGLGTRLVQALIGRAEELGKHVMVGAIDAENAASLHFHERLGFERVAHLREVGYKFGRYLDLILVQRLLPGRDPL